MTRWLLDFVAGDGDRHRRIRSARGARRRSDRVVLDLSRRSPRRRWHAGRARSRGAATSCGRARSEPRDSRRRVVGGAEVRDATRALDVRARGLRRAPRHARRGVAHRGRDRRTDRGRSRHRVGGGRAWPPDVVRPRASCTATSWSAGSATRSTGPAGSTTTTRPIRSIPVTPPLTGIGWPPSTCRSTPISYVERHLVRSDGGLRWSLQIVSVPG